MKERIEELKKIVKDGMILTGPSKFPFTSNEVDTMIISRLPNNVLRLNGQLISWKNFVRLLAQSDYELPQEIEEEKEKKSNWGGFRVAGPDKKLGPKKKDPSLLKKSATVSMTEETKKRFETLADHFEQSRPEYFKKLIDEKYESALKFGNLNK